jgi:hypothetical protein
MRTLAAVVALISLLGGVALVTAGCEADASLGGLLPRPSSLLIALDESGSCWAQARETAQAATPVYTHVSGWGPNSVGALVTGGQGAAWELETYGEQRQAFRERVHGVCQEAGRVAEWGTDICALLDRVQEFIRDEGDERVTVVIISDFVADPPGDGSAAYRDPATFAWQLPASQKARLRLYFASDEAYGRLREAWEPQLTGADVRFFRPNHIPSEGDR